jgi:hypothetical protein
LPATVKSANRERFTCTLPLTREEIFVRKYLTPGHMRIVRLEPRRNGAHPARRSDVHVAHPRVM